MKPRTKRQHEVFALSKTATKVCEDLEKWALTECNDHIAFATKNRYWCTLCGSEHTISVGRRKTIKCPECNTNLQIKKSQKRKFEQRYYVGYAEILGDYQVIRLFRITSGHAKGKKPWICAYETIMQFYPENHTKVEYVARTRNMGTGDPCCGNLEIRRPGGYNEYLYNPCPWKFHPDSTFKAEYTKLGIDHRLEGLSFRDACRVVWRSPRAETILKARQTSLLTACYERMHLIDKYWNSVKIAIRHRYQIKEADVWLDHISMLDEAGKDIRNPKYICSKTLFRDHQRMVEKKRKIQERLDRERIRLWTIQKREMDKKQMIEDRQNFEDQKGCFFGLQFSKGDLQVKILESIEEYKTEGDTLNHCLYTNTYFRKKDTIVFSATFKGERVETLEFNIVSMRVVQCRGKHNQPTDHHDAILELFNQNIHQIAKRMQGEQKKAG